MFKVLILTLLSIPLLMVSSCKPMKKSDGQGLQGKITWLEGNQMPMMSEEGESSQVNPKGEPVKRMVLIYPLTKLSDAQLEGSLFTRVKGEAIATVESNAEGEYAVSLAPGNYSVFIQEEEGLFANMFDGNGNIQPVQIKKNEWTTLDIIVNYKAFF